MLENISIHGFRKYKDFSIGDFGKINFILGSNNVGKTSILEAVFAWACGQNVIPFMNIPLARGRYSGIQQPYWVMEELLAAVNDRKQIPLKMAFEGRCNGKIVRFDHTIYPSEILGEYDTTYKNSAHLISVPSNGIMSGEIQQILPGIPAFSIQQTAIAKWEVKHNGKATVTTNIVLPFSPVHVNKSYHMAKFIDVLSHTAVAENVQIYASLKRENMLDEVTKEISRIYPEVIGFDMIPYPDGSQSPVSVIKKSGVLPLYACGDGIQRWFYILGAMALYKNSIICIDEIDTGFHHDAQEEFATHLIRNAVRNNVQLFITTHNMEFLDSFLKASSHQSEEEKMNDIKVITLRDTKEGIKARTLSAGDAYKGRSNYNLELR